MTAKKKVKRVAKPALGAPKRKDHGQVVMPTEVVLGPKALQRIFINLITGGEPTITPDQAAKISNIFAFIDYKSQLVINTGAAFNGSITVRTEPISAAIVPELHAFALVDTVDALARIITKYNIDLLLQLIAARRKRELLSFEVEAVTKHFNALIQLINPPKII